MEPTSLDASIAVNKAAKRVQIKFRLQPSFMIRPYKVIKFFVQMQVSSFLFFIFLGVLEGQFCKADSNC